MQTAFQRILNLHREEFTAAIAPAAPGPQPIDASAVQGQREHEALRGVSAFRKSARAAARRQAAQAASAEIEQETARRQRAQADLQIQLDEQWHRLLANDPEVVFATLTEAFEDNEAPAAVAGVRDGEVSVVVLAPDIEMVPERMPRATEAGNLSLAKMTKSTRNSFYLLLVCGHVLVTVRETLAVAPGIESVRVVVVRRTSPDAYGAQGLECLLAAVFSRDALQGIQWQTADAATIVQDASTGLRIRQGAANIIQPLDLSGEPDLAALLQSVDLDDPGDSSGKDQSVHDSDDRAGRKAGLDTDYAYAKTPRGGAFPPGHPVRPGGPAPWQPRPGWGTVRDHVSVANDHGGTDMGCRFIPDDGGGPIPIVVHDSNMPEVGEYARAIMLSRDELSIKVSAASMTEAEEMFGRLNDMEPAQRALMYKEGNDLYEDCGWAWTPDYKLVRAAPGMTQ
ncbi:MAG TPA: hypothetical protein VMV92_10350 [Streptosporangiaceae bacterium]|nr:hypothetical protein [Streptosporangiaceae bacterium]